MHFTLIDAILEAAPDKVVAIKQVSLAEEYLQDHFPDFPVLPGVMMLEAMTQAARALVQPIADAKAAQAGQPTPRLVLGQVRALKYGRFVKPGRAIRVEVTLSKDPGDGTFDCKGEVTLIAAGAESDAVAASGRLLLRPVRIGA